MLTEIKKFKGNAVAFELTENFTEADEMLAQKVWKEKLDAGYETVNCLVKFTDLKVLEHSSCKAIIEDAIFGFKYYKTIGKAAIVADSEVTKEIVKMDNFVLYKLNPNADERYFETSQFDEAMKFISPQGE